MPLTPPTDPISAVTHSDPYAYYAALRLAAPVHRMDHLGLWAVVDSDAIGQTLNSAQARTRPPTEPVPRFLTGTRAEAVFAALARMNDGPRHGPRRDRVTTLLRGLSIQRLAVAAQRAARQLARGWHRESSSEAIDLISFMLPVTAIALTLGWSEADVPSVAKATAEWVACLTPLADDTARAQGIVAIDRLLSHLAVRGITEIDDAAAHIGLLMQPHDATAGLIGSGILRLACDESLRSAALDGWLPWSLFGAEVMRHDPSIHNTRRTLAADERIGGQLIPAGSTLLLVLAAAARDPTQHADPDQFRLDRPARTSLVLGAGAHMCPGSSLALVIAQAAWQSVISRETAGALGALVEQVRWRASVNVRMPVFGQAEPIWSW